MLGELRGRTLWVVLACLVCQMALGYGYFAGPLAPHLLEEFGWSRALLASAQAPQVWIIGLASPLLGWLLVRAGPRAVMTGGALLLGTAFVIGSGLTSMIP